MEAREREEKGRQGGRQGKTMHLARPWACRSVPGKSWLSYNFPPERMARGLEGWALPPEAVLVLSKS